MLKPMEQFRAIKLLKDGTRVLLRPLESTDREALVNLYTCATDDDIRYFNQAVKDPQTIDNWLLDRDLSKVIPMLAIINNEVIGNATLHFGSGLSHHIGWIRIYLRPDYRHRGIGTAMVVTVIELARMNHLQQLVAEIAREQVEVIKAFESLNFKRCYRHPDYYLIDGQGPMDLDVFILKLTEPAGAF
jgi:L-amino acid N-acyltransferase YncA